MEESHAPPYTGHRGIQATTKAIMTYFYWPQMELDICTFIFECVICQEVKYDRGKQPCLLQPLLIPRQPWESSPWILFLVCPSQRKGIQEFGSMLTGLASKLILFQSRKPLKLIIWLHFSLARFSSIMGCPLLLYHTTRSKNDKSFVEITF